VLAVGVRPKVCDDLNAPPARHRQWSIAFFVVVVDQLEPEITLVLFGTLVLFDAVLNILKALQWSIVYP
jgi:hypothetical protein